MYRIERTEGRIVVIQGIATTVYSAESAELLIYKANAEVKVAKVGSLTDEQLLLALVNQVRIQIDK